MWPKFEMSTNMTEKFFKHNHSFPFCVTAKKYCIHKDDDEKKQQIFVFIESFIKAQKFINIHRFIEIFQIELLFSFHLIHTL